MTESGGGFPSETVTFMVNSENKQHELPTDFQIQMYGRENGKENGPAVRSVLGLQSPARAADSTYMMKTAA